MSSEQFFEFARFVWFVGFVGFTRFVAFLELVGYGPSHITRHPSLITCFLFILTRPSLHPRFTTLLNRISVIFAYQFHGSLFQVCGDHLFDHVLCADRVTRPKPAPDMIQQILSKSSLGPDEALYVGDMTIDIETGREANVKTVAVITGSSHREEVVPLKPFAIIDQVGEVAGILEGIQAR